ncbi:MAG: cobalt ECF transporter T component CbiQ [Deltaproteobacteria bacterium]
MKIEEFALGDSIVHRLDPRVKIVSALAFAVAVAVNHSLTATLVAILFPVSLILAARMDLGRVLVRLALVNGFIAFLWIFLPFGVPGETIYSVGPLHVTREGLYTAMLITAKSNSIVLATIALLGTSPVFDLAHALSHLGCPDKLVHLFFFSFRYVHVIHDEYHRLRRAAKVRAFHPRTDIHTYRTFAYFIGMLLVRSFQRAQRILDAMKCRGFRGKFYILHHYNMSRSDYAVGSASALVSVGLLVLTVAR